jgi:site-specific DNA recombinase
MTQSTTSPRVAIYARYSSEVQSSASIEDQLRVCHARADREGWTVVAEFTDAALSGATMLRPGYQALLSAMREGTVDLVLAESLDRFSRDLEHIAAFHKQAVFAGVRVVTLAEGEVGELAIGLKRTMGALYLKDLADKTRRGEEGRIRKGRAIGKPAYGYRVARRLGDDGEPERGLREIDPAEAAVVRRIFRAYAAGQSPMRIARTLNEERVPAPGGAVWSATTIRGRPTRRDGVLYNPIYAGQLAWNRRGSRKDPSSGRTVRHANEAGAVVTVEVPALRIVEPALWEAVQARLAQDAAPRCEGRAVRSFWRQRRPAHLLTGKVVCGCCGGSFHPVGKDYLGCYRAQHRGCSNRRRVRRPRLEARVLDALRRQLMPPDLVAVFIEAYRAEWNRLAAEQGAGRESRRRELQTVERQLENLVDAIADGLRSPALQAKLDALEARRAELRLAIDEARPVPPVLHPRLAEVYRQHVAQLQERLRSPDATEALEAARALIDKVIISPPEDDDDPPGIELVGHLQAMLHAGTGTGRGNNTAARSRATRNDPVLNVLIGSAKAGQGPLALARAPPSREGLSPVGREPCCYASPAHSSIAAASASAGALPPQSTNWKAGKNRSHSVTAISTMSSSASTDSPPAPRSSTEWRNTGVFSSAQTPKWPSQSFSFASASSSCTCGLRGAGTFRSKAQKKCIALISPHQEKCSV